VYKGKKVDDFALTLFYFISVAFFMSEIDVRFEVFAALTMKNAVFRDLAPCGCCKNRRNIGTYLLHILRRVSC
jgi:hypothetical protein